MRVVNPWQLREREGAEAVSEDRRSVRNKSAPPKSTASRYDVGGYLEI